MKVVLIGMPGSGKSELGRRLAAKLRLPFVDSDVEIARRVGMDGAGSVLRARGEAAFRELESECVAAALASDDVVLATGGGAPTSDSVRRAVRDSGARVLALYAPLAALARRSRGDDRPLLDGDREAALADLWQRRQGVYAALAEVWLDGRQRPGALTETAAHFLGLERLGTNVYVGAGARRHAFGFAPGDAAVVAPPHLWETYGLDLGRTLFGRRLWLTVPDGEASKSLRVLGRLYRAAARRELGRDASVVALGGGVVTDLAGHFAATYMRGVRFVSVPTSLLAQVDAALGGKTGVDLPEGKNLVGSFWNPHAVLIDPEVLQSLPLARVREGLAEVVKIALARDPAFVADLEALGPLPWDAAALGAVVRRAAALKLAVTSEDPLEQGLREVLNFGHTLGHAIESASAYRLAHGEAVAIGMSAALRLSERMLGFTERVRAERLITQVGLPLTTDLPPASFLPFVGKDKKRRAGQVRMVLLDALGSHQRLAVRPEDIAWAASEVARG